LVHTLKIDHSFTSRLQDAKESLEIVRAVVTLAHNLGLDVIAEGIETANHLAMLKILKCEFGQGYFYSKPIDPERAEALIARAKGGHCRWLAEEAQRQRGCGLLLAGKPGGASKIAGTDPTDGKVVDCGASAGYTALVQQTHARAGEQAFKPASALLAPGTPSPAALVAGIGGKRLHQRQEAIAPAAQARLPRWGTPVHACNIGSAVAKPELGAR
jgi:hypothetical protein